MSGMVNRFTVLVTSVGIAGGAALVVAPFAEATDDNNFCNLEQSFVPQVQAETTTLQAAVQKKSWTWGDPAVQDATNAITRDCPNMGFSNSVFPGSADRLIRITQAYTDWTLGDNSYPYTVPAQFPQFNDDATALRDAMNEQLTTLRNQNAQSDVLPDAAATLTAAKNLNNDCHVGPSDDH